MIQFSLSDFKTAVLYILKACSISKWRCPTMMILHSIFPIKYIIKIRIHSSNFTVYIYGIEYYRYEDEDDHSIHTFYTLYMIPTFSSLSNNRQHDVMEYSGGDGPNTIDVFDYGISIVFDREDTIEEYDKSIIDKIASIVDNIYSIQ